MGNSRSGKLNARLELGKLKNLLGQGKISDKFKPTKFIFMHQFVRRMYDTHLSHGSVVLMMFKGENIVSSVQNYSKALKGDNGSA